MKKLALNKETVRKLDDIALEKVAGGWGNLANTTMGKVCPQLSACPNKTC